MKYILFVFVTMLAACSDSTPVVNPTADTETAPPGDTTPERDGEAADLGPDAETATDVALEDSLADALDVAADLGPDADRDSTADVAEDSNDAELGDSVAPDTSASAPKPPLFDLIGAVELELRPANPWVTHDETRLSASFRDRPYVDNYVEHARVGACAIFLEDPAPVCEPACSPEEFCQRDGTCHAFPAGVSAGPIALRNRTSAERPISLAVIENDPWVYYEDQLLPRAFFAPGDLLEVSATGAIIPAFSAVVKGVAPLVLTSRDTLVMDSGTDLEVAWVPAGDSSKIEMILNAGWHGRPPVGIIRCEADDADGRIVVAASLVQELPYCAGICLFQHPNWIERHSRAFVDTARGWLSVQAYTRVRLLYALEAER